MPEVTEPECTARHKSLQWFIGVLFVVFIAVNGIGWSLMSYIVSDVSDEVEKVGDRQIEVLTEVAEIKSDVGHLKQDIKEFTNGKH